MLLLLVHKDKYTLASVELTMKEGMLMFVKWTGKFSCLFCSFIYYFFIFLIFVSCERLGFSLLFVTYALQVRRIDFVFLFMFLC